jgi:hypothetical protein
VEVWSKFLSRGATEDIVHIWNQSVDLAVAHAREVECRRTHDDNRQNCHALYFDTANPIEMLSYVGYGVVPFMEPRSSMHGHRDRFGWRLRGDVAARNRTEPGARFDPDVRSSGDPRRAAS